MAVSCAIAPGWVGRRRRPARTTELDEATLEPCRRGRGRRRWRRSLEIVMLERALMERLLRVGFSVEGLLVKLWLHAGRSGVIVAAVAPAWADAAAAGARAGARVACAAARTGARAGVLRPFGELGERPAQYVGGKALAPAIAVVNIAGDGTAYVVEPIRVNSVDVGV